MTQVHERKPKAPSATLVSLLGSHEPEELQGDLAREGEQFLNRVRAAAQREYHAARRAKDEGQAGGDDTFRYTTGAAAHANAALGNWYEAGIFFFRLGDEDTALHALRKGSRQGYVNSTMRAINLTLRQAPIVWKDEETCHSEARELYFRDCPTNPRVFDQLCSQRVHFTDDELQHIGASFQTVDDKYQFARWVESAPGKAYARRMLALSGEKASDVLRKQENNINPRDLAQAYATEEHSGVAIARAAYHEVLNEWLEQTFPRGETYCTQVCLGGPTGFLHWMLGFQELHNRLYRFLEEEPRTAGHAKYFASQELKLLLDEYLPHTE